MKKKRIVAFVMALQSLLFTSCESKRITNVHEIESDTEVSEVFAPSLRSEATSSDLTVISEDIDRTKDLVENLTQEETTEKHLHEEEIEKEPEIVEEVKEVKEEFQCFDGFVNENTTLYYESEEELLSYDLEKFEPVHVMDEQDDMYLVKYTNGESELYGAVSKDSVTDLGKDYLEADVSDQKLRIVRDGEDVLVTDIVTGKPSTPTPYLYEDIDAKVPNVTLTGPTWNSFVKYWMPFLNNAYGVHDASWQPTFGGDWYLSHGSHGCVNIPPKVMPEVYEKTEVGMYILIHK